ncbi:hypothetical protein R83H12_01854 [Fibrobacteria bacterium R8-3-H12]
MRDSVVFAVGVVLALVLVISCAEDYERDNPRDPKGINYSPLLESSSSSPSELEGYCVYSDMRMCFSGSYSSCPGGGEFGLFCPYLSSSSSANSSQNGQSSSGVAVREYDYCVFTSDKVCFTGPMSECPQGSTLSNSCPYNSSSSSVIPSSSSEAPIVPSSSSIVPSSSSEASIVPSSSSIDLPSSSSVALSSSSIVPSSSSEASIVPSSSSIDLPSSSSVALSSSTVVPSSSSEAPSSSSEETPSSSSSVPMCGELEYTPEIQGCCNGSVYDLTRNGKAQFCDERDGQRYVYVSIGEQVWMAENLNYAADGSRCYGDNSGGDSQNRCGTYGRLYNWATAMALPSSCNTSTCASQINAEHKGVCPTDWHLPSNADWNDLMKFVNPECTGNGDCAGAGTKLKAVSGWNTGSNYKPSTDNYGFSALPGGYGNSDGNFNDVGINGNWWSATENNANRAYYQYMYYNNESVTRDYYSKSSLQSVRCLQD